MDKKKIFTACMCLLVLLCGFTGTALAADEAEPEVVQVEEQMEKGRSFSVNKIFGGFALASLVFLTYGCATAKDEKKTKKNQKKKR